MLIQSNQNKLDTSSLKELASGGEGTVYMYGTKVLKIYHTPRKKEFENHLKSLSTLGKRFVKPETIWYTTQGLVAGFEMEFVDFNKNFIFHNLTKKSFCLNQNMDSKFKIQVLKNLREAIEECHSKDIVIGDLNQYNFFVTSQADIIYVDVDSFSTKDHQHSSILLDDIRDWTTTTIGKMTDIWAYSILSFWIFTYVHPFKFVCPSNSDSLESRVRKSLSILSNLTGTVIPKAYEKLPDMLETQFKDIFRGRRFFIDFNNVQMQVNAVVKIANIVSQALNIKELYTGVRSVLITDKYISVNLNGESKLIDTRNKGSVIEMVTMACDILYPSNNANNALQIQDKIFDVRNKEYPLKSLVFYYNGSLISIDYESLDVYDISSQLAGIYKSSTPVFGKSFIKMDNLVQNMSGKKFLVLPVGTSFQLFEIDLQTKNVFSDGNYAILEIVNKGQVRFMLQHLKTKKRYEMDYYAYFASKGDVVFYPDDKLIHVIKDGSIIASLDCDICTRESKLYQTDSGILLLESGTLYLLNTK